MQRDVLLLGELIEAAEQAQELVDGVTVEELQSDSQRRGNRIVHGYWSIDLEILHTTARQQPPAFVKDVRQVLAALSTDRPGAQPL
ncbi:MAG TPA: HepT-like ribonuclease domain-containing protein [Kribbellaceae bacterium]